MTRPILSYCGQEVRRHDHDRFLTCLFAPAERREALFALYAFNLEVAKTAEVVSEAMLGRIRLQWWRECLDGIYGGTPRDHGVVRPLGQAVSRFDLSRSYLDALIDAREFDLESRQPADLAELEDYAAGSSANLMLLALEILGARHASALVAGRHVGIAWALAGLLRAISFHARQSRVFLPRDLTEAAGVRLDDLQALRSSPGLAEVTGRIAERARDHLATARELRRGLPAEARSALALAVLAERYLDRIAAAGNDPFAPKLESGPAAQTWRLLMAAVLGRY